MTVLDLAHRALRTRRLVLAAALAAGLAVALAAGDHVVTARVPSPPMVVVTDAAAAELVRVQVAADPKAPTPPAAEPAPEKPGRVDAEITIDERGVSVKRRNTDRERRVDSDGEFESFEQFVEQAPWLAGLVFMVTALVFLVPLLVIILVIWYKMRSNRLRNETMLKLAERGVVAPAAAMDAVAAMPAATALEASPATAPLYEQAKQVRRRAAWSDLRKGVILSGVGLGLTAWSLFDDATANGFGLILLFVGIGYVILWYFEERQITSARDAPPDRRGGA